MKKWTNVRDCFQRSERNHKAAMKSGSARQPTKTYIYNDQLQFLKKTTQARATDDSFSESVIDPQPNDMTASLDDDEGSATQVSPRSNQSTNDEVRSFRTPVHTAKKKRKVDPIELELLSALQENPNRHTSFFNGIIPTLNTFDDDEIVDFQLNVMKLISHIKKKKKTHPIQLDNVSQIQRPSAQQQKTVNTAADGRTYHELQRSSMASIAGSSNTSAASYYENIGNGSLLGSMSPASTHLSDYSDNTVDDFNFTF